MLSAVITADIVNSTRLSKADYRKLLKSLEAILDNYPHEFFRGDSLQVLCRSASDALRLVLQLRVAAIRSSAGEVFADVRASIAIGTVKFPVKSLKTMSGEVFILSGRSFDKLPKEERLIIVCDEKNKAVNAGLHVISLFIDYLFQRLTVKQAAVVFELLMNRTQTETAKRLQKTQATIHKHAQSAGWPQVESLLTEYEKLVQLIAP